MPSTNMYKVTQVATGVAGAPYYITGYFDAAGGTAQQAADGWRAAIFESPIAFKSPYRYESITTVDTVDPMTGDKVGSTNVSVASIQFTSTSEQLPPANTLLLGWRTGAYVGGREVRGRTNISGLLLENSAGGRPSTSTSTIYQGKITGLLASNTTTFVVWSRKAGAWFEVTSGYVDTQFAVLKSRRD